MRPLRHCRDKLAASIQEGFAQHTGMRPDIARVPLRGGYRDMYYRSRRRWAPPQAARGGLPTRQPQFPHELLNDKHRFVARLSHLCGGATWRCEACVVDGPDPIRFREIPRYS